MLLTNWLKLLIMIYTDFLIQAQSPFLFALFLCNQSFPLQGHSPTVQSYTISPPHKQSILIAPCCAAGEKRVGAASSMKCVLPTGRFSCFRNTLGIILFKNFKFYLNVVIVNFTTDRGFSFQHSDYNWATF